MRPDRAAIRSAVKRAICLGLTLAGLHCVPGPGAPPGLGTPGGATVFPGGANTGVPPWTTLSPYPGPLTITDADTVIDGKQVDGDLVVDAPGVTVTNSRIDGRLVSDGTGSVTVQDSEIDGGSQEQFPAVSSTNITLRRVEVTGGQHSVQCSAHCVVEASWLHDQYLGAGSGGHVNAFISNGGSHLVLRGNTLECSVRPTRNGGGCTADLALFGDFARIRDVTIEDNLFKSASGQMSYCISAGFNPAKPYGAEPSNVRVRDNVFEQGANHRCGIYGPVTSYLAANGNAWSGNVWRAGGRVPSS